MSLLMAGHVEVRISRFLKPDDLYFEAQGLTTEEHAKVRAVEEEVKRAGGDHRRARLMATIETGKVRTVHCGTKAAAQFIDWINAGGRRS